MLHDKTGKFMSPYSEPRAKPIQFRLPTSLDARMRQVVARSKGKSTSELSTADIREWVEEAIDQKLRSKVIR